MWSPDGSDHRGWERLWLKTPAHPGSYTQAIQISPGELVGLEFPQHCNALGFIERPYGISFSPLRIEGSWLGPHISLKGGRGSGCTDPQPHLRLSHELCIFSLHTQLSHLLSIALTIWSISAPRLPSTSWISYVALGWAVKLSEHDTYEGPVQQKVPLTRRPKKST